MTDKTLDWEARIAELWATLDTTDETVFVTQMDGLASERPEQDAAALFERACARDATGHSDLAVPLYRQALASELSGIRRRRAVIQLASSLRNLDQSAESVALLTAEQNAPTDELQDELQAFLALALADVGREREGLAIVLKALAPHLTRYQRSASNYARLLTEKD